MEDNSISLSNIESSKLSFTNDSDFCTECGAILNIDCNSVNVECTVCHHRTSLEGMLGVKTTYTIDFTPLGFYSNLRKQHKKEKNMMKENDNTGAGQMDNDRECTKCGHKGMAYTTMQLRSADEGQTVFYLCPKCKNREVENS